MYSNNIINENDTLVSDGRLYDDVFIPADFENIILKHVILNCFKNNGFHSAPLLLIQGKKGEGKTFMTETVLKGNGIFYKIISSSVLAGSKENDAVNNLLLYYNACQMNPEQGKYSALVIDDFHLSIAITRNTANHTTNADNLLSALMNIADKKTELKAPIILIGNDFTDIYVPLTRFGRMNISTWTPTILNKVDIVRTIIRRYPYDTCLTSETIKKFIERYKNQYIGFYEQVIENVMLQDIKDVTLYFASQKGKVRYSELKAMVQNKIKQKTITFDLLCQEADKLLVRKLKKLDN